MFLQTTPTPSFGKGGEKMACFEKGGEREPTPSPPKGKVQKYGKGGEFVSKLWKKWGVDRHYKKNHELFAHIR